METIDLKSVRFLPSISLPLTTKSKAHLSLDSVLFPSTCRTRTSSERTSVPSNVDCV
jgi:hypothetical protein